VDSKAAHNRLAPATNLKKGMNYKPQPTARQFIISVMKQLESGKYYLEAEEVERYRLAAGNLEGTLWEIQDITQPLDVGQALFLRISQLVLDRDRETVEALLEEFDRQLARIERPL
jgi:hypothetical protein